MPLARKHSVTVSDISRGCHYAGTTGAEGHAPAKTSCGHAMEGVPPRRRHGRMASGHMLASHMNSQSLLAPFPARVTFIEPWNPRR